MFNVKKLSGRKYDIVSQISTILGGSELSLKRKERQCTKQPSSLHTIFLKALKRQKKAFLNVMAAHHMMHDMYKTWKSESPVSFEIADLPQDLWCSVPELHPKTMLYFYILLITTISILESECVLSKTSYSL